MSAEKHVQPSWELEVMTANLSQMNTSNETQIHGIYPAVLQQYGLAMLHPIHHEHGPYSSISQALHDEFFVEPVKEHNYLFSKRLKRVISVGRVVSKLPSSHIHACMESFDILPVDVIEQAEYSAELSKALYKPARDYDWPDLGFASIADLAQALDGNRAVSVLLIHWMLV